MSVLNGIRHLQHWQIYGICHDFIHIIYDEAGGRNVTCPRAFSKIMAEQRMVSKTLKIIANCRLCFTYLLDYGAIMQFLSWEELSLCC